MNARPIIFALAAATAVLASPVAAQDDAAQEGWAGTMPVFFETGSAAVTAEEADKLDTIARTFRDGAFSVVEVAGIADTVGSPQQNLFLSNQRAQSVANGLIERGLDPLNLQLVSRGNGALAVNTDDETSEPRNRVAEISWR